MPAPATQAVSARYLKLIETRNPSTIPKKVLTHGEPEIIQPD